MRIFLIYLDQLCNGLLENLILLTKQTFVHNFNNIYRILHEYYENTTKIYIKKSNNKYELVRYKRSCSVIRDETHQTSVFVVNIPSRKLSGGIHLIGNIALPPFL